MYYASNACVSAKMWTLALMKAYSLYLWSTNDGNTSWTVNWCQGHCQVAKSQIVLLAKILCTTITQSYYM